MFFSEKSKYLDKDKMAILKARHAHLMRPSLPKPFQTFGFSFRILVRKNFQHITELSELLRQMPRIN